MADRQDTSQDFNPKHRVVGAIILVVLAVILVPLILRDRAPSTPTPPTADGPPPETRLVVTPVSPAPLPDKPAEPVTIKTIPSLVAVPLPPTPSEPSTVPTKVSDTPPATIKPPAKPPGKPSPVATASGKGWIVQVGAFSHTDNAKRLKENLVRHGYAPELDKIALNAGEGVRVRVGPYSTEADARTAQARIQRELGIKGVVRAYP